MRFFQQHTQGVTLVQTLIIVGIIAILSSLILANMGEARKKARDKERVSDLQQIQLALRLYKDLNRTYPLDREDDTSGMNSYDAGVVIGSEGASINDKLQPYLPVVPKDKMQGVAMGTNPFMNIARATSLSDGTAPYDVTYAYVYDSNFDCPIAGNGKKVLYAKSMELSASSNWATVCGGPLPDAGTDYAGKNTHIIILK